MGTLLQDQDMTIPRNEDFCLRWNDFESQTVSAFRNLRNDQDFCDVRLAVTDNPEPLKAHRVVLAACSPYFRAMFRANNFDESTSKQIKIDPKVSHQTACVASL